MVNLERDAFTLQFDASQVSLDDMYSAILDLGYFPGLNPPQSDSDQADSSIEVSPIDSALELARGQGKLVFADFSAEWCAACKVLEQRILGDENVQSALEAYIFVEVDTDIFPQTASTYQVVGMPTLLVLNDDGEELFRSVGLIETEVLYEKLTELSSE